MPMIRRWPRWRSRASSAPLPQPRSSTLAPGGISSEDRIVVQPAAMEDAGRIAAGTARRSAADRESFRGVRAAPAVDSWSRKAPIISP